jgi:hypothetical protein
MSVESFRIVEREAATDERAADRIIAIVYGSNVLAQFVAVTQFVEFLCWSWKMLDNLSAPSPIHCLGTEHTKHG